VTKSSSTSPSGTNSSSPGDISRVCLHGDAELRANRGFATRLSSFIYFYYLCKHFDETLISCEEFTFEYRVWCKKSWQRRSCMSLLGKIRHLRSPHPVFAQERSTAT
jgi:hypothetical protein